MHKNTVQAAVRRLTLAADLLEERGWTRMVSAVGGEGEWLWPGDRGFTGARAFCAVGAVAAADLTVGRADHATDVAIDALNHRVWVDYGHAFSVSAWNDSEATCKRDVVRLLRRTARKLAREHGVEVPA